MLNQGSEMFGIRSTELINVLIIVTDSNHSHIVVDGHKSFDKLKFMLIHILSFIDNQNTLGYLSLLNLAIANHLGSIFNDVARCFQRSYLAEKIKAATGCPAEIVWDALKPDGTPRKLCDTSLIRSLGWVPKIDLDAGLERTIAEYRSSIADGTLRK